MSKRCGYTTLNPFWPDDSSQNKPSCHKHFHLNLVYICCLIQNLINGLDWTAAFPFFCLHHAIQENLQAKVQSSPETSQRGEGVQNGLGRMSQCLIEKHWMKCYPTSSGDKLHSHWLIAFHFTIFLSCYSNTKNCLHITGQFHGCCNLPDGLRYQIHALLLVGNQLHKAHGKTSEYSQLLDAKCYISTPIRCAVSIRFIANTWKPCAWKT